MIGGYITTVFDAMEATGLTYLEYGVATLVHGLSNNRTGTVPGWCNMSKERIAQQFKITKRTVIRILNKLEAEGWLEKGDGGRLLRTSEKWEKVVWDEKYKVVKSGKQTKGTNGEKMSPPVKKCHPERGKNVTQNGEKMSPYIYIDNNKDNKSTPFLQEIKKSLPVIYQSIFESYTFRERLQRVLKSENLQADFHKDLAPIIEKWMKTNWAAGNMDRPANKVTRDCMAYILEVVRQGGHKKQNKINGEVPKYTKPIIPLFKNG